MPKRGDYRIMDGECYLFTGNKGNGKEQWVESHLVLKFSKQTVDLYVEAVEALELILEKHLEQGAQLKLAQRAYEGLLDEHGDLQDAFAALKAVCDDARELAEFEE